MKKIIFHSVLFFLVISTLSGQIISPSNFEYHLDNMRSLRFNDQIEGYLLVTPLTEKLTIVSREYRIDIFDKQLLKVHSVPISLDPIFKIVTASSNDEQIVVVLFNQAMDEVVLQFLDLKGQVLYKKTFTDMSYGKAFRNDPIQVYPFLRNGFLIKGLEINGKRQLLRFNKRGEIDWPHPGTEKVADVISSIETELNMISVHDDFLVYSLVPKNTKSSQASELPKSTIHVLDLRTGEVLFEVDPNHERGFLQVSQVIIQDGYIALSGMCINQELKPLKSMKQDIVGMFSYQYTFKGNPMQQFYLDLVTEIKPFCDSIGYDSLFGAEHLYVHDLIRTNKGESYIFCQSNNVKLSSFYKSTGRSVSSTLFIIRLDAQFKPDSIFLFERNLVSPIASCKVLNSKNGDNIRQTVFDDSDFLFTSVNNKCSQFYGYFLTALKSKELPRKYVIEVFCLDSQGHLLTGEAPIEGKPEDMILLPSYYGCVGMFQKKYLDYYFWYEAKVIRPDLN